MKQAINQLVSILKAGQPVGGMFKGADKSAAVLYYYKDGTFYAGNTANGGPASVDEDITEEVLRARLEGHFNSISVEESVEDAAHINQMFNRLQGIAVREAEAIVAPAVPFTGSRPMDITDTIPVFPWEDKPVAPKVKYTVEAAQLFGNPEAMVMIPAGQAYALLNLLDEMSVDVWVEDNEEEYAEAIDAMRNLYKGLPRPMQKDIDELEVSRVAVE